jgi:hypothetical protein
MNRTATQCRQWAKAMRRSIGNEQVSGVLAEAADEIERLEREVERRGEAATPKTDGKAKRQG